MKSVNLALRFSFRVLRGEWQHYILPFLSLVLSAVVITTVLLLTTSAADFLKSRSREMVGGDLSFEASYPLDAKLEAELSSLPTFQRSDELRFSATLHRDALYTPISIRVVDNAFPLVGQITLHDSLNYRTPSENEILLDEAAAKKLAVQLGDTLTLGRTPFKLIGVIASEPDSLIGSMQLYPRAILTRKALHYAELDPALLRATHRTAITFSHPLSASQQQEIESLFQAATSQGYRVKTIHQSKTQSEKQLLIVRHFLVMTTLITLLMTILNVYISTQFILKRMQHSFTLLQVLGVRKRFLSSLLASILISLTLLATLLGLMIGQGITALLFERLATHFNLTLSFSPSYIEPLLVALLTLSATWIGFLPSWVHSLTLTPRALLTGDFPPLSRRARLYILALILLTLTPFWWISALALESSAKAFLTLSAILLLYALIAASYRFAVVLIYRYRTHFPFSLRVLWAQKKHDGVFGTLSFTSLFLALTAMITLSLTHTAMRDFFKSNLSETLPTTYLIDVQPHQKSELETQFPELVLFANVRARILKIDDLNIQERIAAHSPDVSRELGREFNINYRYTLLDYEKVVAGRWSPEQRATFSVERNFAERTGIQLGSEITLLIQGFPVEGRVTSVRETDQRNGLPFFFILGAPDDFELFPATWFGYAHHTPERHAALSETVAKKSPNITVIDTHELGDQIEKLISRLIALTFVVLLPTLGLAMLLIVALTLLSYGDRRRDAARLLAMGASSTWVRRLYLIESLSTTLFSFLLAYALSSIVSALLARMLLEVPPTQLFSLPLFALFASLFFGIALLSFTLWRGDHQPLQQVLNYEENHLT
jgi:putative ABC transport system permease protein